jgi:DNA-binding transcriptional LysR family regulator
MANTQNLSTGYDFHMELKQLRYFLAVAETGHITRAAEQLGMQQPPLSQQIKALEADLGFVLFQRHPKGVTLTDAGRLFQTEATRLLGDYTAMRERMLSLAEGKRGLLSVAFTSSAAAHAFTPETLRACRSRYPGIALTVSENHAAGITEAIAASRLDCGFLRVPVSRPPGVALETLLAEPAMVALPRDHALARDTAGLRLEQLEGERLVLVRRPGAPGLYANLLALCAQHKVRVKVAAEVDRMMTNLNLVAAGAGISIVPASMCTAHAHAIVYRPFDASIALDAPLTLAWRTADCTGPTASFVELVRKLAAARRRPATARATRGKAAAAKPPAKAGR